MLTLIDWLYVTLNSRVTAHLSYKIAYELVLISTFYPTNSSAINSACFNTVSVASFCMSGG